MHFHYFKIQPEHTNSDFLSVVLRSDVFSLELNCGFLLKKKKEKGKDYFLSSQMHAWYSF